MKYIVIIVHTGQHVFESKSVLRCAAYIRHEMKEGAPPGSLAIMRDWPTEKRCHTCTGKANCPAFDTGVIWPCPYYHQEEV